MPILDTDRQWIPEQHHVTPPLNPDEIPGGFSQWVNWNGWWMETPPHLTEHGRPRGLKHAAYDFAAFVNPQRECVLGLPIGMKVRAIADGIITGREHDGTQSFVRVTHRERPGSAVNDDTRLSSLYLHVMPEHGLSHGSRVHQGQPIGRLVEETFDEGDSLVHLHFEMHAAYAGNDPRRNAYSPDFFPGLTDLNADRYGHPYFRIRELGKNQPVIRVANTIRLDVNNVVRVTERPYLYGEVS